MINSDIVDGTFFFLAVFGGHSTYQQSVAEIFFEYWLPKDLKHRI